LEIERKFLVPSPPDWLSEHPSQEIRQGYLTRSGDETEVRVRRRESGDVLTVKRGAGRTREETELALTSDQADELWPLTERRRLRKRRHRVEENGTTIEVDVYGDALDGLCVAEIEFPSEEASDRFDPPPWLGRELTGETRYANELLAEEGRPEDQE
jgi:adenylate cyclase